MRIGTADSGDGDRTARARIRDGAIRLFAEAGYSGTSIRDVARAAGVSPGLVQHHFGSKESLRAACDAYVREQLRETTARKLERREYDGDFVSCLYESGRPVIRYVVRGLTERWPGCDALFDQSAADAEQWLTAVWPARFPAASEAAKLHAAVLASMSLGTLVLHEHVARYSGVDPLAGGQQHRGSEAMIELFARLAEFFDGEQGRSMRAALAEYAATVARGAEGGGDE